MKPFFTLFFMLFSAEAFAQDCPFCASLQVNVSHFRNQNGIVRILLVKDEKTFNETDPQKIDLTKVYFRSEKIKGSSLSFDFPKLPSGDYAYKVFHDENENEILDSSLLGKPREGVAISGYDFIPKKNTEFSVARFVLKPKAKIRHLKKLQYFPAK